MSQKGKQICSQILIVALMLAIIIVVSMGRATEDYSNVIPEDVCYDIDGDGYVVDKADLKDNWANILAPKCPSVKKAGDCDNYDPAINPGAEDIEGDGIDQNCDGADGIVVKSIFGVPIIESQDEDNEQNIPLVKCNNNGTCEKGENILNCNADCRLTPPAPACNNNGVCDTGENSLNCSADCPLQ